MTVPFMFSKSLLKASRLALYCLLDSLLILAANIVKGLAHRLISALPRTESLSSGSVGLPSNVMSEESSLAVAARFTCCLTSRRLFCAATRVSDISVGWRGWRENEKRVGGLRAAATQRPAKSFGLAAEVRARKGVSVAVLVSISAGKRSSLHPK